MRAMAARCWVIRRSSRACDPSIRPGAPPAPHPNRRTTAGRFASPGLPYAFDERATFDRALFGAHGRPRVRDALARTREGCNLGSLIACEAALPLGRHELMKQRIPLRGTVTESHHRQHSA